MTQDTGRVTDAMVKVAHAAWIMALADMPDADEMEVIMKDSQAEEALRAALQAALAHAPEPVDYNPKQLGPAAAASFAPPIAEQSAKPQAAPDGDLVGELERLLADASDGPWAYRPNEYDDWGIIRGPEKNVDWADYPVRPIVGQARHSDLTDEKFLSQCRKSKTDPWGGDAKLIVWFRNHAPRILTAFRQSGNADALREAVIEECARVADRYCEEAGGSASYNLACLHIREAIRNLTKGDAT